MVFDSPKINYVAIISYYVNAYVCLNFYVIDNVNNLQDLGIIMPSNCSFEQHIIELCKRCTGLCGWILSTFSSRESTVMMILFKSLVLSRLDYGSQLWSPTKICGVAICYSSHLYSIISIQFYFQYTCIIHSLHVIHPSSDTCISSTSFITLEHSYDIYYT